MCQDYDATDSIERKGSSVKEAGNVLIKDVEREKFSRIF